MKLIFKQKLLSWFDSYDIFDENNNIYFKVKGQLSFGHLFKIYDANDEEVGQIKQRLLTFLPKYDLFVNNEKIGEIKKEISFFKPKFSLNFNDYSVEGNFLEWDYQVKQNGIIIASITKEIFKLTDTYIIDVKEEYSLIVLMIVIAIDSNKDIRSNSNN